MKVAYKADSLNNQEAVTDKLDFSIILINFDSGKYIEPCLEAVGNQEFTGSKEVIVVNNRSTDGSKMSFRRN